MNNKIIINLVSPCATFEASLLNEACQNIISYNYEIALNTCPRNNLPKFLNGTKLERIQELVNAEINFCDAMWCVRGGVGALELIANYMPPVQKKVLIGFSDATILHLHRFLFDERIGIHADVLFSIKNKQPEHEMLKLLITKNYHQITYPVLTSLNFSSQKFINGTLLVMNLSSLQTMIGSVDIDFFKDKILAIEDNNLKHYQFFRMFQQFKNIGLLKQISALILGHVDYDRQEIINETILPLSYEHNFMFFDWPYFGHASPNLPLLFGAPITLTHSSDNAYTLTYI